MTIALGILGKDAMILAADSQVGTGCAGDFKLSSSKISLEGTIHKPRGAAKDKLIAITGAGSTSYLWALKRDLMDVFRNSTDLGSFEPKIEEAVFDFYERHIIPFNPQQWGDLRVELIIAAKICGAYGMWTTSNNKVTRASSMVVVGAGEAWVRHFTKGACARVPLKEATILAAYAVFVAKERAEGCGKETQILAIPMIDDSFYVADEDSVEKMDKLFSLYEQEERQSFWKSLHLGFKIPIERFFLSQMATGINAIDAYAKFRLSAPRTLMDQQ